VEAFPNSDFVQERRDEFPKSLEAHHDHVMPLPFVHRDERDFIQLKMHKQDKLRIFSSSQKGFVARVPGYMEHAVMTRELMAHAIHSKRDLHMIQIDFTNAFGSVP
jgi:hypothetical protein